MKILITGVSSGIGLSLAELFQKEEVWGLSQRRPPERLSIRLSACDVTDWHQLLEVEWEKTLTQASGRVVIDANAFIEQRVRGIRGLVYRSVGRPRNL
jgi:nucleoside-diphosphate-sugar epimerase